jgi:hypothetical protein
LRGLRGDRCPECGQEFDRSSLPWVNSQKWHPHPLANSPFVLAVIISGFHFGISPSTTNTVFQIANVVVIWGLAGLWVRLRFRDLTDSSRQHVLLWLLLLCWANSNRPNVSSYANDILRLLSLTIATVLLIYLFFVSRNRVFHSVIMIISTVLLLGGVWLIGVGIYAAMHGLSEGQSYSIMGVDSEAVGEHHFYAIAAGAGYTLLGIALLWITLKRQRATKT